MKSNFYKNGTLLFNIVFFVYKNSSVFLKRKMLQLVEDARMDVSVYYSIVEFIQLSLRPVNKENTFDYITATGHNFHERKKNQQKK